MKPPVSGEKIFLTQEEKKLPLKELMAQFGFSKATASRVRKRGYFRRGHHNSLAGIAARPKLEDLPTAPVLQPGDRVELSEEEKKLSARVLARRYHVGKTKAEEALRDGWIELKPRKGTRPLLYLESPPDWTAPGRETYNPESRYFRVNLAPAELSYPTAKLVELYRHFGMTPEQAVEARQRAYFCPNASRPSEPMVDADLFEQLADSAFKDAEIGAKAALRHLLGSDWRKRLKGVSFEDVAAAALEMLRDRSAHKGFPSERWRIVTAKFGAMSFLGKELRRQRKEATTVDRMEGRFDEDE